MTQIDPTAQIHKETIIGDSVTIGPFVVIDGPNVILGDNVHLVSHVHIEGRVTIGEGTIVSPFTVIGTAPEVIKKDCLLGSVNIGRECNIRENTSINCAYGKAEATIIGDESYLMGSVHVGHNAKLGQGVIITQGSKLAGNTTFGDYSNIGAMCGIHQGVNIGGCAFVGGMSAVTLDIPPYCTAVGVRPALLNGLNRVGLMRNGYSFEDRKVMLKLFEITFRSGLDWVRAKERINSEIGVTPISERWISFGDNSKMGLASAAQKNTLTGKREKVGR